MARVCIDPGHCGRGIDPGAVLGNRLESDDVLRLALAIVPLLEEQGVEVTLTRDGDKRVSITERCTMANRDRCDYFLSLHRDAAAALTAHGISLWVLSYANAPTVAKAQKILDKLLTVTPTKNRGVHKGTPQNYPDFGVNTGTNMASALLELGFVTNAEDNVRFDTHVADYAAAITKALCEIVGVAYKPPQVPQDKPEDNAQNNEVMDASREALKSLRSALNACIDTNLEAAALVDRLLEVID